MPFEHDAPTLAAEVIVRLQERDQVPGAPQEGCRSEPANAAAYDDHSLSWRVYEYTPKEIAATSRTPAAVPATYGKAIEYL